MMWLKTRRSRMLLLVKSMVLLIYISQISCSNFSGKPETLFTSLPSSSTGINFQNELKDTPEVNAFTFHSFYNGGGVASGDINNDGLQDLFFCGNQVRNRLYLNLGNFKFKDISSSANISSEGLWYTGATFADVNGDGWIDIYVCRAADFLVGWRGNQLFINNGDMTFSERASEYKLDNTGFATHSVFFDYDNDSDLDCYLLSNSNRSSFQYNPVKDQRKVYAEKGGNKLYRNDGNVFVDVTKEAGIYSSVIGFGLGVTISDLNKDGWQDIYISNDFFERDYLYINNRNGTFTESIERYLRELSLFSMGADIADINNDTYPDIYVTDMLPQDEGRLKAKTSFETWEKYQTNVKKGYYHQFLRNVLQLNRGPLYEGDSAEPAYPFSEVSRLAGVHATDWSWGALIADYDNDGLKDIFVSNGMYKDVTDQDFIQFVANDTVSVNRNDYKKLLDNLPTHPLPNFAFKNNGDLSFGNFTAAWGLDEPGFSNGSVYTDLDNDGDLDLITNNVNAPSRIYRNNSSELNPANKFLKVVLQGSGKNRHGFGSKITLYCNKNTFYLEQMPARGFLSTVDQRLNFGLGECEIIDSLVVEWPGELRQRLEQIKPNQTITLRQADARAFKRQRVQKPKPLLIPSKMSRGLDFVGAVKAHADFNHDKLLYHSISTNGPRIAVSDVNGDALEDVFISGKEDQAGAVFIQSRDGTFLRKEQNVFSDDAAADDTDCFFADLDNDGDKDLFVSNAGAVRTKNDKKPMGILYLNDGKGKFSRKESSTFLTANICVVAGDLDGDGDLDIVSGTRSPSGRYGSPGDIRIYDNDGKANFKDVTAVRIKTSAALGLITDLALADVDNDQQLDIVACGHFMPITILKNHQGTFSGDTSLSGLRASNGWWNRLLVCDLDHDGDMDIVAGNHGLNSRFKASPEKPITMYAGDLDKNGTDEQIICTYNGDTQYPMVLRHDLVAVIPSLKKKFLMYNDYKEKTIDQIFTPEQLANAVAMNAYHLESCVFTNDGKGNFIVNMLPVEAQFSPVFALCASDIDGDGQEEIILGGNLYESKPEAGIYDGSYGLVLKRSEEGNWKAMSVGESNFYVKGELRDLVQIKIHGQDFIAGSLIGDTIRLFQQNKTIEGTKNFAQKLN